MTNIKDDTINIWLSIKDEKTHILMGHRTKMQYKIINFITKETLSTSKGAGYNKIGYTLSEAINKLYNTKQEPCDAGEQQTIKQAKQNGIHIYDIQEIYLHLKENK